MAVHGSREGCAQQAANVRSGWLSARLQCALRAHVCAAYHADKECEEGGRPPGDEVEALQELDAAMEDEAVEAKYYA